MKDNSKYVDLIKIAFDYQEQDDWKDVYQRLRDYYSNRYFEHFSMSQRYIVSTIWSLVKLILPNLYFKNPHIKVKAKNPAYLRKIGSGMMEQVDNIAAAQIQETAINDIFDEISADTENRKAIRDCLFAGFGVTKIGYSVKTESIDNISYIKDENPFIMRIDPRDFGIDPMATSTDDARFIVHRMIKPIEEVKKTYGVKDLTPCVPDVVRERLRQEVDSSHYQFVELFEFHDQAENEIVTLVGDEKKIVREKKNPYKFKGSHFDIIKLGDNGDSWKDMPMFLAIEDQVHMLNEVLTYMMKHLRMFPAQVLAENGAMDENEIQQRVDAEQGSILFFTDLSRVKERSPVPMGADYFNVYSLLQNIIDRILGIPDFQRMASRTRKTATQVQFEQGDVSIRREYFLGFVRKHVLSQARKLDGLAKQYFDRKRYIRIESDAGVDYVEYSKDDIQGEYQFDFDMDEFKYLNQVDTHQLLSALQILSSSPVLQPILRNIDPLKAAKEIFRRLNLQFESISRDERNRVDFIDPEDENIMAAVGKRLEAKEQENHEYHIDIHINGKRGLKENDNEELRRHTEQHLQMSQKKVQAPRPQKPTPQELGQATTGMEGGSMGPLNL